jgi:catechol 2,3-dioxygenase-like lactoylglutathione lyase family enzyme
LNTTAQSIRLPRRNPPMRVCMLRTYNAAHPNADLRGEVLMAKLRHIAISVADLKSSADFYEKAFGMNRLRENNVAVSLSDGVVNITLLKFPTDEMAGDERGKDFQGIHHLGFVVDNVDAEGQQEMQAETKYRGPDGVIFDLSSPDHRWPGTAI